jgi:RimJ/RimL family protein N-acetyltransferase
MGALLGFSGALLMGALINWSEQAVPSRHRCSNPEEWFVMVLRVPLETARLRLEPLSGGHAAALHQAVIDSRPELLQWMPWARAPNLEGGRDAAARGEAAWRDGREFHFVVVERSTDEVLGVAGLNREGESARSCTTGSGLAIRDWDSPPKRGGH